MAIPKSAAIHYKEHRKISNEFNLPHLGSLELWNDYAGYGLFVYDYKPHQGPYLKLASPIKPMEESLREQIMQLKDLPVIDKSFVTEESLEIPLLIFDEQ